MIPAVPYVPDELTDREKRALERYEKQLEKIDQTREETRQAFAAWVRETGLHKVARAMGVPSSRLNQRLRLYEGKRKDERRRGSSR